LFHASNIKSYLTDPDYQTQNPLPDGLNPIKIVADFLQQVHEYSVTKMNGHFKSSNTEQTDESLRDDKIVDKRQIRYIVSYPDNQNEGEYTAMMKEALELAGIISPSDPPERLIFRPESEATAYACTVDGVISCPSDPYIVCDIGRTGFGISTIQADELAETGAIEPHFECSSSKCGSSEPDKNMKKYLENKISASDENDLYTLERVRERVFDVYIDRIAVTFFVEKSLLCKSLTFKNVVQP
jgi:hypothetical protein